MYMYHRQLFDQVWDVKPHKGRERKMWGKSVVIHLRRYC